MKKNFGLWIFILINSFGFSQTLTIKNKLTHQPLDLVTIYSRSPEASAITGTKGTATINNFKGADSIYFRLIGYESITTSYLNLKSNNFILLMKESKISLNEHVVSATRWKQNKREVPNKITAIKPSDIAQQNPQTAADLLELSGEVYIQKSQLGGGAL